METATNTAERRVVRLTVAGFAAYCLFVLALKWFGFSAVVFDHGKEVYHAQELRWVYDAANPPLYTWLLYGFQQVFGVRLATVATLNTLLLFLIFVSSFVLARRVLGSPLQAALAAWSLMLVGQYHKFLYTMSHSLLAAIFCPLMLWAILRIATRGRLADYVVAGLVVGLGLLSKFLFLAALGAAVVAALGVRTTRTRLLDPKTFVSLGLAVAIFAPFVVAGRDQWSRLTSVLRTRTGVDLPGSYLSGLGDGFVSLLTSIGEYTVALAAAAVAALLLARWVAGARAGRSGNAPGDVVEPAVQGDALRFVIYMVVASLVLLLVSILAADVSIIKPRFIHMFLFPLPVLAVAVVARARTDTLALRGYAVVLGLIGAGILAVRVVNTTPVCLNRCEELVPFGRVAQVLTENGFRRGTIFAYGVRLGGNMVLQFPGSRVDVAVDRFVPAPAPAGRRGQCLVIWRQGDVSGNQAPSFLIDAAGISPERARADARSITLDWRWYGIAVVDPTDGWRPRRTTWHYILVPDGTATCR